MNKTPWVPTVADLRAAATDLGWMSEPRDAASGGRRPYAVRDREGVAKVVRQLVEECPGTWAEKARAIGISQPTLSRLARAQMPVITANTFNSLIGAVLHAARRTSRRREVTSRYGQMVKVLNGAVQTASEREATEIGRAWCRDRIVRTFDHSGPIFSRGTDGIRSLAEDELPSPEQVLDLPPEVIHGRRGAARWKRYVSLRRRVLKSAAGRLLAAFDRWLVREYGALDTDRALVARVRVLEPLLDAYDSAFIEPAVEEFSGDDLVAFVRAGIVRERALLKVRGPIDQRVSRR